MVFSIAPFILHLLFIKRDGTDSRWWVSIVLTYDLFLDLIHLKNGWASYHPLLGTPSPAESLPLIFKAFLPLLCYLLLYQLHRLFVGKAKNVEAISHGLDYGFQVSVNQVRNV
jgi:hypothetical protein